MFNGNSSTGTVTYNFILMPPTIPTDKREGENAVPQTSFSRQTSKVRDLFSIPAPIKTLFDLVPVVVYPSNELPQRAPKPARIPTLYVFTTKEDAVAGKPSFNPSCLKWQVRMAKGN
jgi:metaxin